MPLLPLQLLLLLLLHRPLEAQAAFRKLCKLYRIAPLVHLIILDSFLVGTLDYINSRALSTAFLIAEKGILQTGMLQVLWNLGVFSTRIDTDYSELLITVLKKKMSERTRCT